MSRRILRACRVALAVAWVMCATFAASSAQAQAVPHTVSHGQFENVLVFPPAGTVQQFVLLLSGQAAPSGDDRQLAQAMAAKGAMVAVVALPPFYRRIAAASAACVYAAGAIENLARYVQAFEKLPTYIAPMLVGTGDGGSFAYALLAQAPADTFTAALSLGFCPRLSLGMPLCTGNALQWRKAGGGSVDLQPAAKLAAPWTVLEAGSDRACAADAKAFVEHVPQAKWMPQDAAVPAPHPSAAFEAAYDTLASHRAALDVPPSQLADLPIVEVPASGAGARFAVLVSGDGGWASIDKHIAAALAKAGIPVAGIDSLRYFWTARTPEGTAVDLDRVIRYYAARWQRSEVILIGYSQGADVLPFAYNRLPPRTRASVRLTALLGPGRKASFEFHVANWIGARGDRPIAPEVRTMPPAGTLCVYGADEHEDALCPQLAPGEARVLALPGGHHLGGDYEALAARILEAVPR
ncbi:virulence factor family protein [Variovorax sp. PBL-E5]|uniref:virulence factor family protein n=1 Tax=Variovorax sp. PBL-E5 TaxID=434014 RepID=UPI001319570B|nr:virulence factor family protein [Variovorax sp. PBL-E5]VTU34471.1 Type IV secretory pathway, VirJ component [Variovorax sp. PBL-E5]